MAEHDHEAPASADLLRALEARAGTPGCGYPSHPPGAGTRPSPPRRPSPLWSLAACGRRAAERPPEVPVTGHKISHASPLSCPARYEGTAPWVASPGGRSRRPLRAWCLGERRVGADLRVYGQQRRRSVPVGAVAAAGAGGRIRQPGWPARLAAAQTARPGDPLHADLRSADQLPGRPGLSGRRDDLGRCHAGPQQLCQHLQRRLHQLRPRRAHHSASARLRPLASQAAGVVRQVGRAAGQESAMVPAGSTGLLICSPDGHAIGSGYQALISALNSLPTRVSTAAARITGLQALVPSRSHRTYWLLFSYRRDHPS